MYEGLDKFFKNKKVLVTGHTGFKGAWLAKILTLWGAKVTGIALEPHTKPSLYTVLGLDKEIHNYFSDIRDQAKLQEIFSKEKPEIVFHLAAQAIVKISFDDPLRTYEVNAIGSANVYQTIRNTPSVRAAVMITSDKVYENKEWNWPYREIDQLGGQDPYSASKAAADIIGQSFIKSFLSEESSPLVAITRAGNVIGGGDWSPHRIIPDVVRAIYEQNEPVVLRSPQAIRPWQFVLEPLSGYLLLGQKLYEGDRSLVTTWNFGPRDENFVPVLDLVKAAVKILGKGSYKVIPNKSFHESTFLKLDISKATSLLGWRPKFGLNAMLEATYGWYRNYYEHPKSATSYTERQISDYFRNQR